jgi:hypothetical protein
LPSERHTIGKAFAIEQSNDSPENPGAFRRWPLKEAFSRRFSNILYQTSNSDLNHVLKGKFF